MQPKTSRGAGTYGTETTYDSPADGNPVVDSEGYVDLFAELVPEKPVPDWAYATIGETDETGLRMPHGRVDRTTRPTLADLVSKLPADGQWHIVDVDFRNALGHPKGNPTLRLLAPEPPAQADPEVERAKAAPAFQVMELVRETNGMNRHLVTHIVEDSRLSRQMYADMRKMEMAAMRDMHAKLADSLAKIDAGRQDPLGSVVRSMAPTAKAIGAVALAKLGSYVSEAGGMKQAVMGAASALAGGRTSEAAAMLSPLLDKGMMLAAQNIQMKAAKIKAEASVAQAEAEARKAEAEVAGAEARVREAEAAARANAAAAEAATARPESTTIVVEPVG